MKKTIRAALIAAVVCFSSSLFAAEPVSFLKETTFNLFEDSTVDNFAWGLEDANGLVLGGFNSAYYYFNLGVGRYIGSYWYSIYETGYIANDKRTKETVNNDAVAKDGINVDFVDKSKDKETEDHIDFSNFLCLSFATDTWGLQFDWFIQRNDPDPMGNLNPAKDNNNEHKESHTTTEIVKKHDISTKPEDMTNAFSVEFKGIQTDEFTSADMFFRLDSVGFGWVLKGTETIETTSTKRNGSIYGFNADENQKEKTRDYQNQYSGAVKGTMGLTMSESEALVSKFELGETFTFTVTPVENTTKTTNVCEDALNEVSYSKTETTSQTTPFLWENTLDPKFIFEFAPEEKLSIKAAAGASIAFGRSAYDSPVTKKTVEKTVTEYKNKRTSTEEYKKTISHVSGTQITDEFTTEIKPYAQLGLVYKIKPGKFHLNLGLNCDFSELKWEVTTRTNETIKESTYVTHTNEAGFEEVTQNDVSYRRADTPAPGDGTAESKETIFSAGGDIAAQLNVGVTWFMTSKVQMDVAYTGEFNSIAIMGANSLLQNKLKIMFSVKF